ncbi:MAG TPA: alpha/beta hydrolase [Actinomycetota bacterium]|jgi:pimeloyl-ACP methyl ester carboxylesterase|nr:alpha/beta hydrolase [Actinomycetota bacterium]
MTAVQAPVSAARSAPEQTRARYPDAKGYVERDGVRLFWERYGDGDTTVLLLPTWSIVHSRHWKAQIPYLARHFRVLTFDGRGNGRSDRPAGAGAYDDEQYVADAVAVLDATSTREAVLIGLSRGGRWAVELAAARPERVLGAMLIDPAISFMAPLPQRQAFSFDEELDTTEGWAKFNRHYWRREYRDFLEFFASEAFSESHSTKQIEDFVGWGLETGPETLTLTQLGAQPASRSEMEATLGRVRCPVLVVHGEDDQVRLHAVGAAAAELTGGQLVTIEGGGHCPQARHPVQINLLIREFVESLGGMAR